MKTRLPAVQVASVELLIFIIIILILSNLKVPAAPSTGAFIINYHFLITEMKKLKERGGLFILFTIAVLKIFN